METVVIKPGPTHLFFTSGIYYVYLLHKKYRVVLVLDKQFNPNFEAIFNKIKNFDDNIVVENIGDGKGFFSTSQIARASKQIITKYKPKWVFLHNTCSPQNIYLFMESQKRRIPIIEFISGILLEDFEKERRFLKRKKMATKQIREHLTKLFKSFLHYRIFPLLYCHRFFYPEVDLFIDKFNAIRGKKFDKCDFVVVHDTKGQNFLEKLTHRAVLMKHPIETVGNEVHKLIFDRLEETDSILILPTTGISNFLENAGLNLDEIIQRWVDVIQVLVSKTFSKIQLKLHPSQADDKVWQGIIKVFEPEYQNFEVLPQEKQAQEFILKNKVIVSEHSSVLWWARFLKGKIIVSLNLFDIPLGDFYKNEKDIYYFDNIEDLQKADLKSLSSPLRNNVPDLINFLENINSIPQAR